MSDITKKDVLKIEDGFMRFLYEIYNEKNFITYEEFYDVFTTNIIDINDILDLLD